MKSEVSKFLHSSLRRFGYWTRHRSVLPLGIDYLLDIQRLSTRYHLPIEFIIDVGAHTGQSIRAFHELWHKARILAFEADPNTYDHLIASPVSQHAECLNLALSDLPGQAPFYRFGAEATCNSLVQHNQFSIHTGMEPVEKILIECNTLDNIHRDKKIDAVDLLKIDTEGHEQKILIGASETLSKRNVKFVFLEFNRISTKNGDEVGALAPLAQILEGNGFSFVATYPELSIEDEAYFSTSNALFFRNTGRAA